MSKITYFLALFAATCLFGQASAIEVYQKGDKSLKIISFVQSRVDLNLNSPPLASEPDKDKGPLTSDFYIRRFRLIMEGNLTKKIQMRFNLHSNNIGYTTNRSSGSYTPSMFVGDAYLQYKFNRNAILNFGILKLPFIRHMNQGAAGLHTLDFHGYFLRQMSGYGANGNIGHRDQGVMLRGLLAKKKIDYRIAVVDGMEYDTVTNESDAPRIVGRVAYNLFDAQPEYFWKGTYLGKKKVVTFGASLDFQPSVTGEDSKDNYTAFGLDVLVDLPMGKNGLVFDAKLAQYGEGGPMPGDKGGLGFWVDLGYRVGKVEPLLGFEQYTPDNEDDENHAGEHQAVLIGLNYWAKGHAFNIKAQAGLTKDGIPGQAPTLDDQGNVATPAVASEEGEYKTIIAIQSQVKF